MNINEVLKDAVSVMNLTEDKHQELILLVKKNEKVRLYHSGLQYVQLTGPLELETAFLERLELESVSWNT
ncbi:hypothetical protein TNCV_3189231 [Trichonephila clavipes]|nr:hypothetical protein TNCV_3189231 [Trichonephila clavipes]